MEGAIDWANNFSWTQQVLPAQQPVYPFVGAVSYLIVVQALKRVSKDEVRSVTFEIFHNAFLVLVSFGMFCGTVYAALQRSTEEGFFDGLVCSKRSPETLWDGPLGAVTYIFYLTKYVEWIDTFVLALRHKPLIYLHLWHHSIMAVVCWSWFAYPWLEGAWWCTLVNSAIHTLMYSFYLATSLKIRIPGKHILTSLQIIQFFTGFVYCITFMYYKISGAGCAGNLYTAVFSQAVNLSFLAMFINFYRASYKKKAADKAKKDKAK